jgi:hypothetical protein
MSSSTASSPSVLDAPASTAPAMSQDQSDPSNTDAEFETAADRLMEELFSDVERMLERGVDLSEQSGQSQEQSGQSGQPAQAIAIPLDPQPSTDPAVESTSLILAPKLTPRPSILEQAESEEELADLTELMAEIQQGSTPEKLTKTLNKLTLALIVTAIAAGGLAWYFRDRLPVLTAFVKSAMAPAPVAVAPTQPVDPQQKQNEDFLAYVGRSLDRIERDAKQQRDAAAIAATDAPSPAPTLERVYLPATPLAQGSLPNLAPNLPAPNLPASVPQPFPQTAAPYIAPQTAPQIAPPQSAPSSATAPPTTPNIAAANSHVLIGILELGDRSAALLEINGTPQRIQIGEAIGASGWTLVSVKNQEAIVRRNGEVRSIYVGQQF